jgi:hypothetical protein
MRKIKPDRGKGIGLDPEQQDGKASPYPTRATTIFNF